MLALLDPSRQAIPEYVEERRRIEEAAGALESEFPGALTLEIADDFPASVAAYKQFDVLLVNAVMDGLNLVAKEAPLVNERNGVVALSVNAGVYEELGEWVLPVEPLDPERTADALEDAIALPLEARAARQEAIRRHVEEHDLAAWLAAQLVDLDAASTMRRA
jgi:trehalose 6-phosphate synthase